MTIQTFEMCYPSCSDAPDHVPRLRSNEESVSVPCGRTRRVSLAIRLAYDSKSKAAALCARPSTPCVELTPVILLVVICLKQHLEDISPSDRRLVHRVDGFHYEMLALYSLLHLMCKFRVIQRMVIVHD